MIRLVSPLFISLFRLSFTRPRFFFSSFRFTCFSTLLVVTLSPISLSHPFNSCFFPLFLSVWAAFTGPCSLIRYTPPFFSRHLHLLHAFPISLLYLVSSFYIQLLFHRLIENNYSLLLFDISIRFLLQLFSASRKIYFDSFLIFLYFLFLFLVFHFLFSVNFYIFLYVSISLLLFSIVFSFFLRSFPRLVSFNCLSLVLFFQEYIESFLFLVRCIVYVRPFLLFKERETSSLSVVSSFIFFYPIYSMLGFLSLP